MTKSEFVRSLADSYDLDRDSAKLLVSMVFDHLKECIVESQRVVISDFGIFSTRFKKSRKVANNLNILNMGEVMTGSRLVAKFTPSRSFKDLLKEEGQAMDDYLEEDED